MASIWKHANSKFFTAGYTDKDGKQVKRSTKQTDRRKALTLAREFERVADCRLGGGAMGTGNLRFTIDD
jgi:hypothetical protein